MNDDITTLTTAVRNRRRELDALMGEARATLLRGKAIEEQIGGLTEDVSDYERVTTLLNSLGEDRQQRAQQTIEELVTRGLQTIFDETLTFHIVQSVKGKAAIVEFVVRSTFGNEQVETPVMDARGGGLAATIGFLLRIVVMLLRSRNTSEEQILVLDETFAHVSEEYLAGMGEFLRQIVDKTGVQIIMVTHQPEFADYADTVYRFSQKDGKTVVTADA